MNPTKLNICRLTALLIAFLLLFVILVLLTIEKAMNIQNKPSLSYLSWLCIGAGIISFILFLFVIVSLIISWNRNTTNDLYIVG